MLKSVFVAVLYAVCMGVFYFSQCFAAVVLRILRFCDDLPEIYMGLAYIGKAIAAVGGFIAELLIVAFLTLYSIYLELSGRMTTQLDHQASLDPRLQTAEEALSEIRHRLGFYSFKL